MTHFAGYVPRFHPSDFETRTRDGVGADWPISYWDLKASFERVERELPVAGQDWPWGDPHGYPHGPHPVAGAASMAWEGARAVRDRDARRARLDHERRLRQPAALHLSRLLPAGLQGERQGLAARHAPARRDRARRRGAAGSMAVSIEVDERRPRCAASRTSRDGREQLPARRGGRRLRLRDRDAATPAQLDERALPARPRQRRKTRSAAT